MSQLKAEVVRVEVVPHTNADKLELVKVKGWQCVAQKGQYKTGDLAVYLPVDSVLPETLVKALAIEKFYSRRLKTIKLRGAISQGMVAPLDILPPGTYPGPRGFERMPTEGDDHTATLGITKWDPPIPIHMAGIQRKEHESFFKYTDIENYKNYPNVFEPGETVVVVEKIHGTNFRAAKIDGELHVGSHRTSLVDVETNLYWRGAKLLDLANKLNEGEEVFGEVYGAGVQDLAYGKKPGEIAVAVFDIMRDKKFLDYPDLLTALSEKGWLGLAAPVLTVMAWTPELVSHATGDSTLAPGQIREGVVIRPLRERFSEKLQGRLIIKAISDEYLLREDGTENH